MQRSFGEAEAEGSKDFELRGLCRFVGRKGFLAMHVCNCSVHLLDFILVACNVFLDFRSVSCRSNFGHLCRFACFARASEVRVWS